MALRLINLLVMVLLASSCTKSLVNEVTNGTISYNNEELIVVLSRQPHVVGREGAEDEFMECLDSHLTNGEKPLRIFPESVFLNETFPWFEPRNELFREEYLVKVLNKPIVNDRLDLMGIRYIVWIDGHTVVPDEGGSIGCSLGPMGGGCFGFVWWDKQSNYEAIIWDIKSMEEVGRISADVTGKSYMPAVFIPIPLVARTQHEACEGLSTQLREFFGNNTYGR